MYPQPCGNCAEYQRQISEHIQKIIKLEQELGRHRQIVSNLQVNASNDQRRLQELTEQSRG